VNRRDTAVFLFAFGATAGPLRALAQAQTPKTFRVGCLWVSSAENMKPYFQSFLAGMRDRGYLPGQNLTVDNRYADGDTTRLPALARELIALRPDVLVGIETPARAMKAATSSIPIVLPSSSDPVAAGLVQSLARPGTNVTGMSYLLHELVAKHVELLSELFPKMSRLAFLNDASLRTETQEQWVGTARTAAKAKGLSLTLVSARDSGSLREAFAVLEKQRPESLVAATTGTFLNLRREIIDGARRLRLPAISSIPDFAQDGGLISYGANFIEGYRYVASFVDKILKGAKPADLPVEQTAKFEFVVNLKSARALGITIPQSFLFRADRVIE